MNPFDKVKSAAWKFNPLDWRIGICWDINRHILYANIPCFVFSFYMPPDSVF